MAASIEGRAHAPGTANNSSTCRNSTVGKSHHLLVELRRSLCSPAAHEIAKFYGIEQKFLIRAISSREIGLSNRKSYMKLKSKKKKKIPISNISTSNKYVIRNRASEGETKEPGPFAVIGASGLIGSWLVRKLFRRGHPAAHAALCPGSTTSDLPSLPGTSGRRVWAFEADVQDTVTMGRAFEGCVGAGLELLSFVALCVNIEGFWLQAHAKNRSIRTVHSSGRQTHRRRICSVSILNALESSVKL